MRGSHALVALVVALFLSGLAGVARASVDHRGSSEAGDGDRARARVAVCAVFSPCTPALEVVKCETGGTYYARSVGRAGERGLFQIHPVHWRSWTRARALRLFEPLYNARFAYRLSRGGRDWGPWSCRP